MPPDPPRNLAPSALEHDILFSPTFATDYKGYFMDVECMWPGSAHDAKVFANSSISRKLRQGILTSTFQCPLEGGVKIQNYLIGDPAYPLLHTV